MKKYPLFKSCVDNVSKPLDDNVKHVEKETNVLTNSAMVSSTMMPNYARYRNGQSSINFETDQVGSQFRLSAFGNKLNTRVDVNNTEQWGNNPDVFSPSNNWSNANRNATTAHWATQRMFSFQQAIFLRNGYDGNVSYPKVLVDWNDTNAQWSPSSGTLRFGSLPWDSLVTLDFVGHEYSHAVNDHTVNFTYYGESGAIDESIADIMGT